MREKIRCMKYCSYHLQHLEHVEEFLEEKAREGWIVYKHFGGWFSFQKEEPQEIRYYVEVFEKERWNNSCENRVNQAYIKECGKKGWKFVDADSRFQIMRCEAKNTPKPKLIPSGKIESIYKSNFKEYFYLFLCLFFMAVSNLFFSFTGVTKMLSSLSQLLYVSSWAVFAVYLLCYMLAQRRWYGRALADAKGRREIPENPKHRYVYIGLLCATGLLVLSIVGFFVESHTYSSGKAFVRCLVVLAVVLLCLISKVVRDRRGTWKMGVATGAAAIAGCAAIYGVACQSSTIFTEVHKMDTVQTMQVYEDALPITLESLGIKVDKDSTYSRYHEVYGEFLIKEDYYSEEPIDGSASKEASLCYQAYRTKNSTLHDRILKEECFYANAETTYEEIKEPGSMAERIYKKKLDTGFYEYIFEFDSQIIKMDINRELSMEQLRSIQPI